MDLLGKVGSLVSINHILIFQIINFAILLFILYKLLYRPLVNFMDQRADKIENKLVEAEKQRKEAAADRTRAAEELLATKKEAYELLQKLRSQGLETKDEIIKAAKLEAKSVFDRSREEVELILSKAKEELRAQVATLSVNVAEKLLQRAVNNEDQQRFIESCLSELENRE